MPQPETDHLAGMPAYLMMQLEARLKTRIREVLLATEVGTLRSLPGPVSRKEQAELAKWMLARLMEKRINDGRQFDSILASSRKAFALAMLQRGWEGR